MGNKTESVGSKADDLGELEATCRAMAPGLGRITFKEAVPSAITSGWGVRWDADMIARDLMQNVRDGNKNRMQEIVTTTQGNAVSLYGPGGYDLKRLYYVGSEKSADEGDIGQYGEGFKAACVGLLRDFHVEVVAISGSQLVRIRLGEEVAGTGMRRMEYDYFEHDVKVAGSYLIVNGCDDVLKDALMKSLRHFFWAGNTLLGELIFESKSCDVYRSATLDGYGFYRGLLRLTLKGAPFVFVAKKEVALVERKVSKDRDRKSFDDEVALTFLKAATKTLSDQVINEIMGAMKEQWPRGGMLLSVLANTVAPTYHTMNHAWMERQRLRFPVFGDHDAYYAEQQHYRTQDEFAKHKELEASGRTKLPGYFKNFGILSAGMAMEYAEHKTKEDLRKSANTRPSYLEQQAIDTLKKAIRRLDNGKMHQVLAALDNLRFIVAHTEAVLGLFKQERGSRQKVVVLAASVFESSFARALSTVLHEMGHTFGYDGSRLFTDALTEMLEVSIERAGELQGEREAWEKLRQAIQMERSAIEGSAKARLMKMQSEDLRDLISHADEVLLQQLEGVDKEAAIKNAEELKERAARAEASGGQRWANDIPADSYRGKALELFAIALAPHFEIGCDTMLSYREQMGMPEGAMHRVILKSLDPEDMGDDGSDVHVDLWVTDDEVVPISGQDDLVVDWGDKAPVHGQKVTANLDGEDKEFVVELVGVHPGDQVRMMVAAMSDAMAELGLVVQVLKEGSVESVGVTYNWQAPMRLPGMVVDVLFEVEKEPGRGKGKRQKG